MKQIVVVACMAMLVPFHVFAQDEQDVDSLINDAISDTPETNDKVPAEGEKKKEEATAETTKPAENKPAEEKSDAEPYKDDAHKNLDPNDPLYWSTMRDVYSLQKRRFQKEGRFGVSVYGGIIPNNSFESYVPIGVRLNYYVLENLGLELAGSYALRVDKGLRDLITEEGGVEAGAVLVADEQLSHINFGVLWSPFSGKTAFYSSALNYFDLYLFAGAGIVVNQTQPDFNAAKSTDVKGEGALGFGVSFYLGENTLLRADFRQFVFQKINGGVANPSEISVGFGYFF